MLGLSTLSGVVGLIAAPVVGAKDGGFQGFATGLANGLIGVVAMWTAFVFVPVRSSDAWRFRALVVTYISLLMVVSNSLYSIKTAALLWLCVGATDVWAGFAADKRAAERLGYRDSMRACTLRTLDGLNVLPWESAGLTAAEVGRFCDGEP